MAHNDGDLIKNRDPESFRKVSIARIPGVKMDNGRLILDKPFLEYVRISTLAVRNYSGER